MNKITEHSGVADSLIAYFLIADLEAVLADVSYLMAMEMSKQTPESSKKIVLPDARWVRRRVDWISGEKCVWIVNSTMTIELRAPLRAAADYTGGVCEDVEHSVYIAFFSANIGDCYLSHPRCYIRSLIGNSTSALFTVETECDWRKIFKLWSFQIAAVQGVSNQLPFQPAPISPYKHWPTLGCGYRIIIVRRRPDQ